MYSICHLTNQIASCYPIDRRGRTTPKVVYRSKVLHEDIIGDYEYPWEWTTFTGEIGGFSILWEFPTFPMFSAKATWIQDNQD